MYPMFASIGGRTWLGMKRHPYYQRSRSQGTNVLLIEAEDSFHYNSSNQWRFLLSNHSVQRAKVYIQSERHEQEGQGYSCGETNSPEPGLED